MELVPRTSTHVRVVVIDADDRVRESLCGLLCIGDRLAVVGSTGLADRALDLVTEIRPDVVLLDPRLPDLDEGVSFIKKVRAAVPGVRVLVLTTAEPATPADVAAAADGSVRKTFRPNDLVTAVLAATMSAAG